jgi:murein L,D-transpeptidase YcbB/YkuD
VVPGSQSGKEKYVSLKAPLPVHLVYLTVRVEPDGTVRFFDDVYGYDRKQAELRYADVAAAEPPAAPPDR